MKKSIWPSENSYTCTCFVFKMVVRHKHSLLNSRTRVTHVPFSIELHTFTCTETFSDRGQPFQRWVWVTALERQRRCLPDNETEKSKHNKERNSRQSDSSDLSLQSGSPSHFQVSLTHSPLAQRNSPAVQFARRLSRYGTPSPPQRSGPSSELSEQSGSPSQLHMSGTHSEVLQRRWFGPQVRGEAHFSSSLPSPQSSSPSHT